MRRKIVGAIITRTLNFLRLRMDLFIGIVFIVLGIAIYILSYTQAPGISDWSLSPAFFPRLAATLICGLGLLLIVLEMVFTKGNHVSVLEGVQWRVFSYVIVTIAIMIFYTVFIRWFGFIISTIITMAAMMVLYGLRRWVLIALISVCVPLIIYFFGLKVMFVLFPVGEIFQ